MTLLKNWHICIYIYVCVCSYIYIYIYIFFREQFSLQKVESDHPSIWNLKANETKRAVLYMYANGRRRGKGLMYIQNILDVSSWITYFNDIAFKQHQTLYRWENLGSEKLTNLLSDIMPHLQSWNLNSHFFTLD